MAKKSKAAEEAYEQGRKYLQGDAVEPSYKKGLAYLREAADLGHGKAQYNLGLCYYQGIGVAVSEEKTIHYLELALRQKQPKAAQALEVVMAKAYRLTERC